MTIQIELSPLMVDIIQDQIAQARRFDENNVPLPLEVTVGEFIAGLVESQLEAMASTSRRPEAVTYRATVESSRKAFRDALFPRRA